MYIYHKVFLFLFLFICLKEIQNEWVIEVKQVA